MNSTNIHEKEKDYIFKKKISAVNVNGQIINTFQDYQIKAYVVRDLINLPAIQINDIINDYKRVIAVIRYPMMGVNVDTEEVNLNLVAENGDCILFEDKIFEISNCVLIQEDVKKTYTMNLINYYQPIKSNIIEDEIFTILFKIFEYMGVEAIRFSPFFSVDYFEKIRDKAFLTYNLQRALNNDDFRTLRVGRAYDPDQDLLVETYDTHNYYDVIINLYDNAQNTNIDVVLSKNDILEGIINKLGIEFVNIKDLQVENINFLSNSETILYDTVLNQKKFIVRVSFDTVSEFTTDYYDTVEITGNLKGEN